jgi:hypothetical protein
VGREARRQRPLKAGQQQAGGGKAEQQQQQQQQAGGGKAEPGGTGGPVKALVAHGLVAFVLGCLAAALLKGTPAGQQVKQRLEKLRLGDKVEQVKSGALSLVKEEAQPASAGEPAAAAAPAPVAQVLASAPAAASAPVAQPAAAPKRSALEGLRHWLDN